MSQEFIASDKALDDIVRSASKGLISYEEMKLEMKAHLGLHDPDAAMYAPRPDTSDALYRRDESQQQQNAAAASAQALLSINAHRPEDREFRKVYRGNEEYEISGRDLQEVEEKIKLLRSMFAA